MCLTQFLHFEVDLRPPQVPFAWECTSAVPYDAASKYAEHAAIEEPVRVLRQAGLEAWLHAQQWHAAQPRLPAQWISCDVCTFPLSTLGKFDVVIADPPWDIHMSLPYGTLSDENMYALPLPDLQEEGLLFLWVTGRAMELGRQLLKHWGYIRIDELIWVKINQMQRLIRTGRTGHWLNHTKEHCFVGLKRKGMASVDALPPGTHIPLPEWMHGGLGNDVIVAPVRDTSRKPDELYDMIEKMCPGGRKVELFGRQHNVRPGWLTLGNQLKNDHVVRAFTHPGRAAPPSRVRSARRRPIAPHEPLRMT